MLSFVHAADLHVDSPLRGLERYEGAPEHRIRLATRQALGHLVRICLEEKAAFLLISGDLFDHDWRDFSTALHVTNQLQQLERAGIPVFLIFGNHDAREEMSRRAPWPKNVRIFDHQRAETETFVVAGQQVAVHGLSFRTRVFTENPVPRYPAPVRGALNIGLLHTSCGGNTAHETYAPCSLDDLHGKGYDYWALGHVHAFEIKSRAPYVVYPGNTQGRHIRETGAKGCVVVEVEEGRVHEVTFRPTDVLRWFDVPLELAEDDGLDTLFERAEEAFTEVRRAAGERLAAVRLRIGGRCRAHRDLRDDLRRQEAATELRARANGFGEDLWLEKIHFRTRPVRDIADLRRGGDLLGQMLRDVARCAADESELQALAESDKVKKAISKALPELADDETWSPAEGDLQTAVAARMQDWLRDAESLLVEALADERADRE